MDQKKYKQKLLEEIYTQYKNCQRCPLAQAERNNIVFGDGNPDADLMLIGEGPGRNEDLQGKPFVGRAGKLLDELLESANLKRGDIFIGNIVKCRPPNNRLPLPNEIAECLPLLEKQIKIIRPKVICTLGSCSTRTLLGNDKKITQSRGKLFKWNNIVTIPTFHPAYILRNPKKMPDLFEDLRLAAQNIKNK
ncbi:uracil-DNA glycosylase [bacterium]|mgnify:CR=1 FL=1|jgi:uracil-DNA glycosylase|nr:uracil-DNA glycosylase [bacterium]